MCFLHCSVLAALDDSCFENVKVYHSSKNSSTYNIVGSSSECSRIAQEKYKSEPEPCDPSVLTLSVSPIPTFYEGNVIPDVRLNFSVLIFEHIDSVDFRLQCLYAPNHEDIYCHDSAKMIVNNSWLWPCRMLQFDDNDGVRLPFQFGYSCFRIYAQSQYMVNVTLYPQNCRSSLIFTAPEESHLFPEIAKFYSVPQFDWSPMLIIDVTESDGVWVRIEKPKSIKLYSIRVDLFKHLRIKDKPGLKLLETITISNPSLGRKWMNTAEGDYVAYAYVPKQDCRLVCPSPDLPADVECKICQHTKLNFTVHESKGGLLWKSILVVEESWHVIAVVLTGVFITAFLGFVYFLYFLDKKQSNLTNVYVELAECQKVLILYSDDTSEHSHAVEKFADLISLAANASVLIDVKELIATGSLPSRWLVDSLGKASSVLLVLSDASEGLLNGRKLVQRRPFPDMFSMACDLVIQECTTRSASKTRFATIRFPYSPSAIPHQFETLGLQCFNIPKELAHLTAFLHRLGHSNVEQDMSSSFELKEFNDALKTVEDYISANQNYKQDMWEEQRTETDDVALEELPSRRNSETLLSKDVLIIEDDDDELLNISDNDTDAESDLLVPSDIESD
ncbi:unnamed protein product [Auanema sp. JU1783]|nr:unnamed protein product [Auanema sp. JU1783]